MLEAVLCQLYIDTKHVVHYTFMYCKYEHVKFTTNTYDNASYMICTLIEHEVKVK